MLEGPRAHPKPAFVPALLIAGLLAGGPAGARGLDDESVRAAAGFAEAIDSGDTVAAHARSGWPHSKLDAGELAARMAFERGDLGAALCRDLRLQQYTGYRGDGTTSGHLVVLTARFAQGWAEEFIRLERASDGTLHVADYVVSRMDRRDGECSRFARRYVASE